MIDVMVEGCGCNLVVWTETDGETWDLHIGPCCEACEKMALSSAQSGLGRPVRVVFESN